MRCCLLLFAIWHILWNTYIETQAIHLLVSRQQQLGRKDRVLQQQQQKLEEAQQKAHEVGLGRVVIMTQVKVEDFSSERVDVAVL